MSSSPSPAIAIVNARKSFGRTQALDGVNLQIQSGECIGLLGASGSGKSTLLRSICGLELLDGKDSAVALFEKTLQVGSVLSPEVRTLRRQTGIIFQQFNLVGRMSLLSNVLTGLLPHLPLWRVLSGAFTDEQKMLALEAARTVITQLPVLLQGQDIKTPRIALARASVLAGLAMSQTQTALAHALSYDLTLRENMAHGHACAVWLPMVWELAQEASTDCATLLHRVFDETNIPGAHQLMQWLTALGVSTRDLRTTTSGRERLSMELGSARGRNFIGSPAEAG